MCVDREKLIREILQVPGKEHKAHSHRQRREMVGCYLYESLDGHLLSFATRLYHHGGSLGAKVNEDDAKVT